MSSNRESSKIKQPTAGKNVRGTLINYSRDILAVKSGGGGGGGGERDVRRGVRGESEKGVPFSGCTKIKRKGFNVRVGV